MSASRDLLDLINANKLDEIQSIVSAAMAAHKAQRTQVMGVPAYIEYAAKVAVETGNIAAARIFFENGVSVNSSAHSKPDEKGYYYPFIFYAVSSRNLAMVKLLVEEFKARVIIPYGNNNHLDEMLYTAVKNGDADIAAFLLDKGVRLLDQEVIIDNRWWPLRYLSYSALNDNFGMIETLLSHGLPNDLYDALHNACESYKYMPDIEQLLSAHFYQQYVERGKAKESLQQAALSSNLHEREMAESKLAQLDREEAARTETIQRLSAQQNHQNYTKIIINLMDYATGLDLGAARSRNDMSKLIFLENMISVAGVNFIGVKIDGKQVTKSSLKEYGFHGYEHAITEIGDLDNITDQTRRERLRASVNRSLALPSPSALRANSMFDSTADTVNAEHSLDDVKLIKSPTIL